MRFAYSEWDSALEQALKRFRDLMSLFNYLLLKAGGDVEQVFKWLEYLKRRGVLGQDVDLEALRAQLQKAGVISQEGKTARLTNIGERQIRRSSLDQIFGGLKREGIGQHRTSKSGGDGEALETTRPWQFGDSLARLDMLGSMSNALRRGGIDEISVREEDLEVYETEYLSACATVLLIDISHSMILYGEDRITPAKQVALALTELILTRYPRDKLHVAVFGDEAREVPIGQLPYLQVGPYHTNTRAGLQLAQGILSRHRSMNRQVFMVTDGKPSAIEENGTIYRNPGGLDPRIVNRTLDEAAACRRSGITITTFMVTQDPYLVNFVDQLSAINKGRAYYSSADSLGQYILMDYVKNRRRRLH
jgi:uncharacterized protein with von Willebrand factor type A (vWA) domain